MDHGTILITVRVAHSLSPLKRPMPRSRALTKSCWAPGRRKGQVGGREQLGGPRHLQLVDGQLAIGIRPHRLPQV
jgi:hypothetical protein